MQAGRCEWEVKQREGEKETAEDEGLGRRRGGGCIPSFVTRETRKEILIFFIFYSSVLHWESLSYSGSLRQQGNNAGVADLNYIEE